MLYDTQFHSCFTYGHHVITLHVRFVLILALVVKLAEEVEGHHSVKVYDYSKQTHGHHQLRGSDECINGTGTFVQPHDAQLRWAPTYLFAIVSYRRQNGAQGFDPHGDVQKMSGEEEVVVMSEKRH